MAGRWLCGAAALGLAWGVFAHGEAHAQGKGGPGGARGMGPPQGMRQMGPPGGLPPMAHAAMQNMGQHMGQHGPPAGIAHGEMARRVHEMLRARGIPANDPRGAIIGQRINAAIAAGLQGPQLAAFVQQLLQEAGNLPGGAGGGGGFGAFGPPPGAGAPAGFAPPGFAPGPGGAMNPAAGGNAAGANKKGGQRPAKAR